MNQRAETNDLFKVLTTPSPDLLLFSDSFAIYVHIYISSGGPRWYCSGLVSKVLGLEACTTTSEHLLDKELPYRHSSAMACYLPT